MSTTPVTEGAAEALLRKLQSALGGAAGDSPSRADLRAAEREHGATATRAGRLLSDLVAGSRAWDLWEGPPGRPARGQDARLPRLHELCVCEPVLRLMRESGELAEREHLLRERDAALAAAWGRAEASDEENWLEAEAIRDGYFEAVARVTDAYEAHYEALRQAATGSPTPLAAPRVRSRLLLQPPLMTLLFAACHQEQEGIGAGECRRGGNALAWAGGDALLDAMTWDVAALAVSAFYVRTGGNDFDAAFPVLVEDYFAWRGTDPRKRSRELREQVAARLEFLCSGRMQTRSEAELWLTDPDTGRRRKAAMVAEGPLLVKRSRFFRPPAGAGAGEAEPETAGYLLSLGEWARPLVAERAMLGVSLRRLAEYDLQRQGWERRIGWYLVFQMNNQASRMTFQDVTKDGKTRTVVTPQHPLRMRTVLSGGQVAWEETARTNPGKVIKQWGDALDALRRDGILGPTPCLDGAADGSDLPARGRLAAMLERRYQFVPGRDLLPHLRAKRGAAERRRAG